MVCVSHVAGLRGRSRLVHYARAACVFVLVVFACLDVGLAQDGSAARREQARQLFVSGVEALDEGRFADAASLLSESLALRDSPPARYNRVLALRGAGQYIEALAEAELFLERATEERHAETRAAVQQIQEELLAAIGRLVLIVEGDPDRLELNGEVIPIPSSDEERSFDPGRVRAVVHREGYEPVMAQGDVVAGSTLTLSVDASSRPLPARLTLDVRPDDATIELDGDTVRAGIQILPPGEYRLSFSADGYIPVERRIELLPGEVNRLRVDLPTPTSERVWSKWWFWVSVIGGAAVVGTTLGLVFRPSGESLAENSTGVYVGVLRGRR